MSWLGVLNFVALQWLGVRLARTTELRPRRSDDLVGPMILRLGWITQEQYDRVALHPVTVGYHWIRWVWPLTGWWSGYRWIVRRPMSEPSTCDDLGEFADGQLPPDVADRMRQHLATCKPCQAELLHHMVLVTRLSSLPPVTG